MSKDKAKLRRKFLGDLVTKSSDEIVKELKFKLNKDPEVAALQKHTLYRYAANFNKAHLKAYLEGRRLFRFGYHKDEQSGLRMPSWFPVQQEYYYE